MKKLFIFLLLIINLNTFALTGGVKGGLNYTIPQAKNGYEEHFSNDYGYTWGGFLSFNLTDKLFLNTELMINHWNFQYDEEYFNEIVYLINNDANFKTFEITLALSYNFFDNFYFDFGIFFGIPVSYESSYTDFRGERKTITAADHSSSPSGGLTAAIGYKYNHFLLFFKYLYNSSNMLSIDNSETGDTTCEFFDSSCSFGEFLQFQLLIGYEF